MNVGSISNSRKALNVSGPIPIEALRKAKAETQTKPITKSKPPAHAQYFETAGSNNPKQKQVEMSVPGTAITTQGGNTVININIDNRGDAYQHLK